MKKLATLSILFTLFMSSFAQNPEEICKWSGDVSKKEINVGDEIDVIFNVIIADGWYMYSSDFDPDLGPNVTIFEFTKNPSYKLIGEVKAINPEKHYDDIWGGEYTSFEKTAQFKARVKILKANPKIVAYYEFQTCSIESGMCLPPTGNEIDFGKWVTVAGTATTETAEIVSDEIEFASVKGDHGITKDGKDYVKVDGNWIAVPEGNSFSFYKKYLSIKQD